MQHDHEEGGEAVQVTFSQHEESDHAHEDDECLGKDGRTGGRKIHKRKRAESAGQKARSLRRLLDYKKDLPDDVREKLQTTADTLQQQHHEHMRTVKRAKFIRTKKALYSKLKFYELKKVQRRLQRTRKQLASLMQDQRASPSIPGLKDTLRRHLDDLNYIRLYPSDEPYISLFPTKDSDESRMKRDAMRQRIRKLLLQTRLEETDVAQDAGAAEDLFLDKQGVENAFEDAPSLSDEETEQQDREADKECRRESSPSKKYAGYHPEVDFHRRQRSALTKEMSGGRSERKEGKIQPLKNSGFRKERKIFQKQGVTEKQEAISTSRTSPANHEAVKLKHIGLSRHKSQNQHLIFNSDSE